MGAYSPKLIYVGLAEIIGRVLRSPEVIEAIKKHGAVHFGVIGGIGALIARCIVAAEVVACPAKRDLRSFR
jgi:fumarate hydratase subunit beta